MAPEQPVAEGDGAEGVDLAKAFQELAKGERAAAALEEKLSTMEARIEALLAEAEKNQEDVQKLKEADTAAGDVKEEPKKGD